MPALTFTQPSKKVKTGDVSQVYPIAIVKGDDKRFHNKFLYLDTRDKPEGSVKVEIPDDCMFQMLPTTDEDKRFVGYLAGASGSGKSYIARQIADNYRRMFPGRPVYLISKLEEDDTIDSMATGKPIRLDWKRWLEEGTPDINALSNSLVIADDYDTIDGKAGDMILSFLNDIAIMGRKHTDNQGNVSLLCLTHYLTNYKKTRLLLNEAHFYVVYPTATSAHALKYLLKHYMGLDDDKIKQLRKMGRWVMCWKMFPQYIMSAHHCELLHHDDDGDEKGKTKEVRVLTNPRE